ncbi:MAG TPA: phosphatidylglycerophosphatase A [Pyrinomonadaceae bacterium]|mgnify:CR=1 FL=1|nr:phosphatidylglycerophosphatase A [Pyrinomonadaceae bacterium]
MKTTIDKRKPNGIVDYIAIALTTWGVGYLPLMPGTFGSMVGVGIYLAVTAASISIAFVFAPFSEPMLPFLASHPNYFIPETAFAWIHVGVLILFLCFTLLGVWASGRATELLGNTDPPEAVVDEVIGQLITFLFVPFGIGWPLVLAGFALFRIFDIWKPYPIDSLQVLPGGIGVCADDILAGVYAGISLSIIYAVSLSF